jgi:hypothetical protein
MKQAVPAVLLLAVLLLLAGPLAAQEESAYDVEGWKKRVASPTYGVVVSFLEAEDGDGSVEDPFLFPGIELRIFNGMNVAKRGGFYTGYEVGTIFFVRPETDPLTLSDGGRLVLSGMADTVFLLSKYGYRIDLGIKAAGLSVGAELGIGAQMSLGGIDIVDADNPDNIEYVEPGFPFSMMLDAAAEGAFRFGQNFRLFARAGISLIPPLIDFGGEFALDATSGTGGTEYFSLEMLPVIASARLGFALNY